jgi:ferric-dicitrate binding protein FerR (iron transport regulator)
MMQKEECIEIFERYVQNRATQDEIKRLSLWIKNNSEISVWFENQVMSSSSVINSEVQRRMLENMLNEIDTNSNTAAGKPINIRFNLRKLMRIAAMITIPILTIIGVFFFVSQKNFSSIPLIVSVERGQKANITLPDGSKVWLNSQSKLSYPANFNAKKRELQLEGEAYFEVFHNPDKPFIVHSKDISVEALGTAFGLKAYNEDNLISSILMRGKIRVSTPVGETILLPNERVVYDKTAHKMVQSSMPNATDFTGWIHNELRFENESLSEIAKTIQRIYNIEIIFTSEKLKHQRFTGTINNNSLESILNIISLSSPVSFQIKDQKVILFENKKLMDQYKP